MLSEETKSLIHLNLMQGVGSITVRKLVKVFDNAENALKASPGEIEDKLRTVDIVAPAGLITRLLHYPLEKELELISKHECHIITLFDEDYPSNLRLIGTPPPVLYVKGKFKSEDIKSIAIVGPRKARSYGQQFSRKLSSALAEQDVTVVSGLAKGIDTCAHRGALDAGGRTIAVLGTGLAHIYPPENKILAEEIIQSGVLISEFPMDTGAESVKFPQRNRIISGLTLGTVVVEAPNRSGSLITAEEAKKQGRKVFAAPDQINPVHSSGCHKLIENGAQCIDNINDLLIELPHLSVEKTSDQPTVDAHEQLSLFEETETYVEKTPSEEKVKSEVIRYFRNNFPGHSIKLEHQIRTDVKERADVALINSKQKVSALVECKRSEHIGSGLKQLDSYLSASEDTRFGFFANSPESKSWVFYTKADDNKLKEINRSEFEKGILDDISIR